MTIKEYNDQLKKINTKWKQKKFELDKKYAFENNTYKEGDIIKVTKIHEK